MCPPVPGLSSSAAYEVLIGCIFNSFCCGSMLEPIEMARIGQYAENHFFGKPCGLMDQAACALGGLAMIDFKGAGFPRVERLSCSLAEQGYTLCIIDCGADHADLTDEYGSITRELGEIASALGAQYLCEAGEEKFYSSISGLRRIAVTVRCSGQCTFLRKTRELAFRQVLSKKATSARFCVWCMSLGCRHGAFCKT